MGEKITHADRVLDHIKTFGKITSLEAFAQYGSQGCRRRFGDCGTKRGLKSTTTLSKG